MWFVRDLVEKRLISRKVEKLLSGYRSKLRERAIMKAKARIALNGERVDSFTEEELEFIVKEEEDKLKQTLKDRAFIGILVVLGVNI